MKPSKTKQSKFYEDQRAWQREYLRALLERHGGYLMRAARDIEMPHTSLMRLVAQSDLHGELALIRARNPEYTFKNNLGVTRALATLSAAMRRDDWYE